MACPAKPRCSPANSGKKLIKDHDGYCGKLNYEANKGRQIDLLLSYAASKRLLPFFLFYSTADANTRVICGGGLVDPFRERTSLFLASTHEIKRIADNCRNKKISKNSILSVSNAFCCLFCCPMGKHIIVEYIQRYFPSVVRENSNALEYNDNNLPSYVRLLLSRDIPVPVTHASIATISVDVRNSITSLIACRLG
jgi:hypothetical protein